MASPELQFLHERQPELHTSSPVQLAVAAARTIARRRIPNEPTAELSTYLDSLEAHHSMLMQDPSIDDEHTVEQLEIRRQQQIERRVIALTPENADKYAAFQAKVARELGMAAQFDPVHMTEQQNRDALAVVRRDQFTQLRDWVGELNSRDNNYPAWFKYWILDNVTKLTAFNEDLRPDGRPRGFEKRSGSSFALFPELDSQSLSAVYEAMVEKFGGESMGFGLHINRLRQLLPKASFAELYAEAQNAGFRITPELKAITTGS